MAKQRRKHKSRWLLLILIFVIPLVYFARRAYYFINALQEENYLKKSIFITQAENQVIKQRMDDYRKGTILETRARDELGMIKKGEKVYLLKK